MSNLKTLFNFPKYLSLLCFILFALAPCSVKEFIGFANDISFSKVGNPSKSNNSNPTCGITFDRTNELLTIAQSKCLKRVPYSYSKQVLYFKSGSLPSKLISRIAYNFPPPYILYKRLKIMAV